MRTAYTQFSAFRFDNEPLQNRCSAKWAGNACNDEWLRNTKRLNENCHLINKLRICLTLNNIHRHNHGPLQPRLIRFMRKYHAKLDSLLNDWVLHCSASTRNEHFQSIYSIGQTAFGPSCLVYRNVREHSLLFNTWFYFYLIEFIEDDSRPVYI